MAGRRSSRRKAKIRRAATIQRIRLERIKLIMPSKTRPGPRQFSLCQGLRSRRQKNLIRMDLQM